MPKQQSNRKQTMPLSLLNPWVILGILAAMGAAFTAGHHQAYVEQAAAILRLNQEAIHLKDVADTQLYKEKQNAQAKIEKLNSDLASGALRLSIRTQVRDADAACGDPQARAELDGQTAQDLVAITRDGDNAIIDLNSCIDRYNSLKDLK